MGNYYSISAGDPLNCVTELTGAPVERIQNFLDPTSVWKKLYKAKQEDQIIICTATPRKLPIGGAKMNPDIIIGNAYSVKNLVEENGQQFVIVEDPLE